MNNINIPVMVQMAQMVVEELFRYRNASFLDSPLGDESSFVSVFDVGSEPLNSSEIQELHDALKEGVVDSRWGMYQQTTTTVNPNIVRLFIWWPYSSAWVTGENHTC